MGGPGFVLTWPQSKIKTPVMKTMQHTAIKKHLQLVDLHLVGLMFLH